MLVVMLVFLVSDAVGGATVSGSLLWDASEDHWMAGALGGEKEIAFIKCNSYF